MEKPLNKLSHDAKSDFLSNQDHGGWAADFLYAMD